MKYSIALRMMLCFLNKRKQEFKSDGEQAY